MPSRTVNPTASLDSVTAARPRPRAIDLLNVAIYPPIGRYVQGGREPLDAIDINPAMVAVSWGSSLPLGWGEAMFGIEHPQSADRHDEPPRRPWLPREIAWGPFYHVEISRRGRVLYAGRMGPQQRTYGRVTGFTAQGYGMVATQDMYYTGTGISSNSSGAILRGIMARAAPHLTAAPDGDLWQDPGVAHTFGEFTGMHLIDVLDQVAAEGDSAGNLVDWMVYEDQMLQLKTRRLPEVADYLVPWSMVPDYYEDPTGMIGIATYERLNSGDPLQSSINYTNQDFTVEHGFQRGDNLNLGEVTATAAIAITKSYLERHSPPVISAAIEAGPADRLVTPYGQTRFRDEVRAGQWVQIEGMDEPLIVMSHDYDAAADVVRMQVGEYLPEFDTLIASLQQDRLRLQRGLSLGGGRAR